MIAWFVLVRKRSVSFTSLHSSPDIIHVPMFGQKYVVKGSYEWIVLFHLRIVKSKCISIEGSKRVLGIDI